MRRVLGCLVAFPSAIELVRHLLAHAATSPQALPASVTVHMPPPHLGERSTHTPRAGSKTFSCRSAFIMVAVFVAFPLSLSRSVATATWQASRHAPRYRVRATASFLSSFPRPSHPLISSMGTRDAKSRPRPTFFVPCGAQNRRPGSVARWGASVATSPDKTLPSNPLRPPSVRVHHPLSSIAQDAGCCACPRLCLRHLHVRS